MIFVKRKLFSSKIDIYIRKVTFIKNDHANKMLHMWQSYETCRNIR
jgi:hypothetical protein